MGFIFKQVDEERGRKKKKKSPLYEYLTVRDFEASTWDFNFFANFEVLTTSFFLYKKINGSLYCLLEN